MFILDDLMYVFMQAENFICFNGTNWLMSKVTDNINSYRTVNTEPFSYNTTLIRSNITNIGSLAEEDVYSICPLLPPFGIKSATSDGAALILGTARYGKVYNYSNDKLNLIFDTQSDNTVYSLLNIDFGTNLAAIDNKLYLIYSGNLPTTTTTTTLIVEETPPVETTTTTTLKPVITVNYPNGGETFTIGDTVAISWFSDLGVSEAVKIDLYNGTTLQTTINSKTANTGTYNWEIPSYTPYGSDYKITITWLTASTLTARNIDISDGTFAILSEPPLVTTTTTTLIDGLQFPNISNNWGIPILEFKEDEYIVTMSKDENRGGILFGTSNGRILYSDEVNINAYLTGNRKVYAQVKDGFGNCSNVAATSILYALYNKIAEINEDKEVIKYKYVESPTAILTDRITAVFLSPVISVKENLGFWKELIWHEEKPTNTEILICVRASDSLDDLKLLPWDICFVSRDSDRLYGSTGAIIRDLFNLGLDGKKYLQYKVEMTSDSRNISPQLLDLTITYATKFAVYFFTVKFALEAEANVQAGLIVASITQPQNTEVKFGITYKNSTDWNDYTIVDPNKFFDLQNMDNIKIGIKMISYDDHIPEVAEFALITGADKDTLIN